MSKPISRLMREGAARFQQNFGALVAGKSQPRNRTYCAVGLAAVAGIGKEPTTDEEWRLFFLAAQEITAIALSRDVHIVSLNDQGRKTPNEIADILEANGL